MRGGEEGAGSGRWGVGGDQAGRQMETTGGILECQVLLCQCVCVIAFGTWVCVCVCECRCESVSICEGVFARVRCQPHFASCKVCLSPCACLVVCFVGVCAYVCLWVCVSRFYVLVGWNSVSIVCTFGSVPVCLYVLSPCRCVCI